MRQWAIWNVEHKTSNMKIGENHKWPDILLFSGENLDTYNKVNKQSLELKRQNQEQPKVVSNNPLDNLDFTTPEFRAGVENLADKLKCDPRQSGVTIPSLIRTNPGTITQKSEKCGRQIQQSGLREPSLVWQMRDQKPKQRWVNKGSAPPLSSPCHQKRSMGEKQKRVKKD